MSRASNGTYTRVANSFSGPTAGQAIDPANAEILFDEFETEITDCASRSGKGAQLADMQMGAFSAIFDERTAPSSPSTNKLALYAKDNGSGTTKLYCKDAAGTETDLLATAALDITGLVAITTPTLTFTLPIYDGANKKITVSNLFTAVNLATEDTTPDIAADFLLSYDTSASSIKKVKPKNLHLEPFMVAVSDETTVLSAGTTKVTFRMPYAFTVTDVRASLSTAQSSGSIFTVDINEAGTSIISTKLTIDNSEKTSTTAATPAVISDSSLADDAEMSVDIDQIGDGTAKGLKITLIGRRT